MSTNARYNEWMRRDEVTGRWLDGSKHELSDGATSFVNTLGPHWEWNGDFLSFIHNH